MVHQERKTNAYFVRTERNNQLEYINNSCSRLLGSEMYYDPNGDLYYVSFHDLSKEDALPENFIQISKTATHGDIYSHSSRISTFKEARVNHIEGGVEDAIRAMDHILENVQTRVEPQISEMGKYAHSLLDLFSTDFSSISPQEFLQKKIETERLLDRVNINPDTIIDSEKKRISRWLLKGSSGKDSLDRQNKLISTMAISAAYRHAIEKFKGINPTVTKYIRMREALLFEREFTRSLLIDIGTWIKPSAIPGHEMFRNVWKKSSNEYFVVGKLNSILYQISLFHVNPYKQEGKKMTERIEKILGFITANQIPEIDRWELFQNLNHDVRNSYIKHKDIYPEPNSTL